MFSNWAATYPSEVWSEKHLFHSSLMGLHDWTLGRATIMFWTGPADLPKAPVLIFLLL